ncbi:MAG: sll0787 family AIR synthase-like protein [Akkermansiaceae bacterium]|nr:sll0787 family AIR synthase-like protein [Akkermansiaceae bacterium]
MLEDLAKSLAAHPAVIEKATISSAYAPAEGISHGIPLGDDCAAIPDDLTGGHLLFAAEGMLESFVADDPWFAGYSAVMVNLSDIAAMGGRPIAITNVIWTPNITDAETIWEGMRAASIAYSIPIVGGHTTQTGLSNKSINLAAAVLGRAGKNLLTSFDAQAGDRLVIAIDMNGAYRKDKPFWNASTTSSPEHLQRSLALLPQLAEQNLCRAAKDISNGGIIGTLAMLCHCSDVGVTLRLDSLPRPNNTDWLKWLISFPSFGYLLAVKEKDISTVKELFHKEQITCEEIGHFTAATDFTLSLDQEARTLTLNQLSNHE